LGVHWHASKPSQRWGEYRSGPYSNERPGHHNGDRALYAAREGERLLAAVALQKIHRIDGNLVAAYVVVVVHFGLLQVCVNRTRALPLLTGFARIPTI
jgi:hypothetical protein